MDGVLLGFGIVLVIVLTGLAAAVLVPGHVTAMQKGLTPAVYYITNPALMFTLLAETDLGAVVGVYTPIALITAGAGGGIYALVSALALRRRAARTAVGAMASSYVNAGNIGLPIALYAVGSSAPVVAVLLAQLLVIAPVYLAVFAWCTPGPAEADRATRTPLWRTVAKSIANPVTVATAAGAALSLTGWRLPDVVWIPLEMMATASIAMLLLLFGMSLHGQKPFTERGSTPDLVLGSLVKLAVMPWVAWVTGRFVFGVEGIHLLGVVVMAALPTAQNVFLFSSQFRLPSTLARDIIFVSSFLSLPVIALVALLLE